MRRNPSLVPPPSSTCACSVRVNYAWVKRVRSLAEKDHASCMGFDLASFQGHLPPPRVHAPYVLITRGRAVIERRTKCCDVNIPP